VSQPPDDTSPAASAPDDDTLPSPTPSRAAGLGGPMKLRMRRILTIAGALVVLVIVVIVLFLTLGGGDGTKETASPLEVRQLVATFDCSSTNPGTPSDVKVTAGQEVVRLGRGGCAVVGPVIDKIDRATKVSSAKTDSGCTVTFESTSKYGEIVDKASVVTNGFARALVGGGYVLDLRARLYPPAKAEKLNVVFSATDQLACDKVAQSLART
jgi:hypothetical protein